MTFMRRVLALGATTLAAAAIAAPALAQQGGDDTGSPGDGSTTTTSTTTTYCRDSSEHPGEGSTTTATEQPPGGWHECEPGEAAGYDKARKQRLQREADAREAQSKQVQADIAREQGEATTLENQAKLCATQPSHAGCSTYTSKASQTKPAPPKPVSYHVTQQEKASHYGNAAGVEVRPVPDQPEDEGLEDAIDVPDNQRLALIDPALRPGPRNLVWFSMVAMAAISSLGYGLWRVLILGDV